METDVKSRIIKFLKCNVQLVYPSQFVLGTINKMSPLIFSGLII